MNPRIGKSRPLQIQSLEPRAMLAGDLRIVELNYHPHAAMTQFGERDTEPDDFEFIEVMNVGDSVLNLNGYGITEGVQFRFTQQFLAAGERLVVSKDLKDFRSRFGNAPIVAQGTDADGGDSGEYKGSLKNSGEVVQLSDPTGRVIQEFIYYDVGEWPRLADGGGSSLEIVDPLADANDPKNWRASAEYGGSPGIAGVGFPGEIVINEILTHTDLPQVDAIELMNRTETPVDMTGWYLTDSATNVFGYQITGDAAKIDPYDYRTFDENMIGFSFKGQESDNAYLIEADAIGRPIRFVDAVSFSATQNGVTLGRWDDGIGDLFPMTRPTFDDVNSGPLIGDVIVSEVHYNPIEDAAGGLLSRNDLEFVELTNRTGAPLNIGQWRLRQSVDFTLPDLVVIHPGESILIVGFSPLMNPLKMQQFRDFYDIGDDVQLLGPYSDFTDPNADQLDDNGETLILERPEDIAQLGLGYVLVDRVTYRDDGNWPVRADGQGASLTRVDMDGYGDFPETWAARIPSPGSTNTRGDLDNDGKVDAADVDFLSAARRLGSNNLRFDLNSDGRIDGGDHEFLIRTIIGTVMGDANLDGLFDSSDLVIVFAAGQYEDDEFQNSGWTTGDWDGDGEFTSGDIVFALASGDYDSQAVPLNGQIAAASIDRSIETESSATIGVGDRWATEIAPLLTIRRPLRNEDVDAIFGTDDERILIGEEADGKSASLVVLTDSDLHGNL